MTQAAPLRLLVCGGRDFAAQSTAWAVLDYIAARRNIECLIHGAARGADTIAGEWAVARGIPEVRFPADWKTHGKVAGPIRNQKMLDEGRPNGAVAFPGGSGTADMVKRLREAGVPVWRNPRRPMGVYDYFVQTPPTSA